MIKIEKPFNLKFFYPLIPNYRLFCSYWWRDIFDINNYINFFKYKYQRLTRGYADDDLWSMDHTLCYLNISMLRKFRECSERGEEFDAILGKIIEGFEAAYKILNDYDFRSEYGTTDDNFDNDAYQEWCNKQDALWKEGMKLYTENFYRLWN